MSVPCTDRVVGGILAGWRYDISGLNPEMARDYEAHFAECQHCRDKRSLHRKIDFALIVLASVSAFIFVVAFGIIRHIAPRHEIWFELGALGGFVVSIVVWLIVAVVTPVPVIAVDALRAGARRVHDRLPPEIRQRIPEELRVKINS